MKTFLFSLIAVLCLSPLFSQQLPALNMKDTVITTTECYLYDPGGFKTGYADGTRVMTFYSASGSTLGISFDSVRLNANDEIKVYDGNSANTRQLTSITRDFSVSWTVKSTGSSLTVKFIAGSPASTGLYGWGAHVRSLINNPVPAQFTSVFIGFNGGNFDLADYDHDGDMDVLNSGKVFRNDTQDDSLYRFVSPLYSPVGYWYYAASAVADFDGDGFKDVFMTGQLLNDPAARLYLNNRNGGFTLSSQSFAAAYKGRCEVVDYNHDGKPDISYIGSSDKQQTTFIFKLYINNGNGTFTEQVTNVAGLYNSSLSWADTDNDGDMDLLMNGQEAALAAHARLFINNNNTFTEKSIGLTQSTSGEISFADINQDGQPDIINTGVKLYSPTVSVSLTELFVNTGNNNFTALTHNLPTSTEGYTDWADYDNDGDADLLMSGTGNIGDPYYAVGIYKNNGNGNFTRIDITNITYMTSRNPVRWIDFNKDGKLDIFVANGSGFSYIAKNLGNDQFTIVTYPLPFFSGHFGAAEITDFDNDGAIDILFAGPIMDNCTSIGSVLFKGQSWSKEKAVVKLTPVVDLNVRPGNPGFLPDPFWKWADFDNDGLPDITVADAAGSTLRIYKNQGNNTFSKVYDGKPGGSTVIKAAFVDLDKDGKTELVVAPNSVYKWNGASFDLVYQDATYCCENFNMQFADYNKDGYPDMALNVISANNASRRVRIYKNDKTGKLVEVNLNSSNYSTGFIRWLDMDNDGDLDLALTYSMLENVNGESFIGRDTWNANYAQAAIGDFNGDGFADIFGFQAPYGSETRNYYGQGSFFFKENTPALLFYGRAADAQVVDIDQDGDLDIIHSTGFGCGYELMLNNSNLLPKHLELINPANGEQLKTGSTYLIRWGGNQLTSPVALLYSTDNGKTYTAIQTLAPTVAHGGTFLWTVPNVGSSDSCIMMITDHQAVSKSAGLFSIIYTLPKPQLSTLAPSYCQNKGVQTVDILNLPPAAESVTVLAKLDAATLPAIAGKLQFNIDTLAVSNHTLTITYSRNAESYTTTSTFSVIAGSTPKVGLQANVTSITNLSTPVVVTATNKQGGGTSPLYTFAGDQLFTNILQQQSSNATLTINPSSLSLGNNKVFVRMKTSDTCFTTQTAIDSIVLVREVSTGITDPDNPSNIINLYPNPFDHKIVVDGLNPSKTYFITVVNSTGLAVYRKTISNSSSENISGLKLPQGLYWISIYEGAQKRKLGTVKMTRLP